MFKKPIKISAQNQLSGKDRKMMKNRLQELFDAKCIDKIMNLNEKIISCKTSGAKSVIYNGDDYPLFVDQNGKGDYFPSLYTAIAFEPLIKILFLNEGVEAYIFNGANLMWPGVKNYSTLGQFTKNQVVGIKNSKGELIAIGAMGCSLKEFQDNTDKNGIAVFILHYMNDNLWGQGSKSKPEVIVMAEKKQQEKPVKKQEKKGEKQEKQEKQEKKEKKGEKEKEKEKIDKKSKKQQQQPKPQPKKVQEQAQQKQKQKKSQKDKKSKKAAKQKQQSSQQKPQKKKSKQQSQNDDDQQLDLNILLHNKKQRQGQNKPIKIQIKDSQKGFKEDDDHDKKQKNKKKIVKKQVVLTKQQPKKKGGPKKNSDQQQQHSAQGEPKQQEQKSTVSTKLMDEQFKQVFLNALKLSKVQTELPIDSGRFFMDFMLLARPPGVKLQIKDTSYKKLGKFYEEMAKNKFIQFKHNKDKKGQSGSNIIKINWQNEQLKNYWPTISKMNEKDIQQKQDLLSSKKILKLNQTLEIQNVYKLSNSFKNVVAGHKEKKEENQDQEDEKNQPEFYSENQVRMVIEKYIDKFVKKDKEKQKDKDKEKEKEKKVDKMVIIDYKNNPYLSELLKKQIEQFEQNLHGDKDIDSNDEQQGKKAKKKKQNILKMEKNVLANRILKTCYASYHIRDKENNIEGFYQGTFKGIQLIAEKSNNKNITKIIGLETFIVTKKQVEEPVEKQKTMKKQTEQQISGQDKQKGTKPGKKQVDDHISTSSKQKNVSSSVKKQIEQQIYGFANILKQKFACSVNVQNLPGKNAGKEIIVHGNFINELQQIFTKQYKLNEEYVTSQNKLDKKKKR